MEFSERFVVPTSFNSWDVCLPSEGYLHSWTRKHIRTLHPTVMVEMLLSLFEQITTGYIREVMACSYSQYEHFVFILSGENFLRSSDQRCSGRRSKVGFDGRKEWGRG